MTSSSDKKKKAYWFIFQNDCLVITKIEKNLSSSPLLSTNMMPFESHFTRQHQLAQFEAFDVYCAELTHETKVPDEFDVVSMRKALEQIGAEWYNIAAKAYAIINWDKNHQYCGRCGATTIHPGNTFERLCVNCGLTFYPRISPSVIVLIHRDHQMLMARSHHFTPGIYGLIAGFVEPGESVEDAVHREVKEEVGIQIKNLRYFGSQSWPFPDSLMIAFMAEYASGELIINPTEIEEAGWYDINKLPGYPSSRFSIARKLIDHFLATYHAQ